MSEQVNSRRAVFDLCKQEHNGAVGSGEQSSDSQLIALHSVVKRASRGAESKERVSQ